MRLNLAMDYLKETEQICERKNVESSVLDSVDAVMALMVGVLRGGGKKVWVVEQLVGR